jgi:hypothetical protein
VVNEASLLAARGGQEQITLLELAEGVRRTRYGVNGRGDPAGDALRKRVGQWLYGLAAGDDKRMKAATL